MEKKEILLKRWALLRPKETPVTFTEVEGKKVVIKDESKNLTSTYKSKHGWMMGLHYLTNHYPAPFTYYLGSTGNAGIADFAYADLLNNLLGEKKVQVVNFYPLHYDKKLLGPDSMGRFTDGKRFREKMERYESGKVIQVDFNKKYWLGEPCIKEMARKGIIVTPDDSMDITEGFKPTYNQIMEELIEQIKKRYRQIPKTLMIIQFGAGMLYNDSKAVAKGSPIDLLAVSTGNKETIADKICDTSETWQESIKDLREEGFTKAKKNQTKIYNVNEQEILYAMARFKELGIEAEPSGAAGMAIMPRLNKIIEQEYELIAIINTGNGIKGSAYQRLR